MDGNGKKKPTNLIIAISCIDSRSSGYIMRSALEYAHENAGFSYMVLTPEASSKPFSAPRTVFAQPKLFRYADRVLNRLLRLPDGFGFPLLGLRVAKQIKMMAKNSQDVIVHVHSFHGTSFAMMPILRLIKRRNFGCVYTFHDVWPFTGGCYNFEQYGCKGYREGCRECAHGYQHSRHFAAKKINALMKIKRLVICPVSFYCARALSLTPLSVRNIEVVPVETDVREAAPDPHLKERLRIGAKDRVIISVCAYWCDLKGVSYIYEVAKRLPPSYKMLIVGSNFETKGYSNIIHVPFLDRVDELPRYLAISDCFVSVTQGDNSPLVLVEAQCCGVPIVGFGHGGTPELITSKSGLMVGTDNNVDRLVKALVDVCENHPFTKEDILASGMRFSSGIANEKYCRIYQSF